MKNDFLLEHIDNKGQGVYFKKYPALEPFSKTSPLLVYSIYIPVIFSLVYWSYAHIHLGIIAIALYFFGGLLFWTLFEYIMHRFLFHIVSDSPRIQSFMYHIHGMHHEYPRDKERLFLPPVVSLVVALILFFAFRLVLQENIFAFFPGFVLGYLFYGSMHYAIHAYNPPFKFMKAHWRNHHLHHYKSPDRGFGVSSPLWDYVFGTMHDTKKKV